MNTYQKIVAGLACGLFSMIATVSYAEEAPKQSEADFQKLMPVTGNVETFFGDFKLDHSFPAQGEADKIYDLMDHQRASQLYLWGLPLVGMTRWHQGYYDAYEDYDYNVLLDIKSFDEGGLHGTFNENGFFNGTPNIPYEVNSQYQNQWGNRVGVWHVTAGWTQAGNTPFPYYKQSVHRGGNADALIVSWPKGIDKKHNGQIRKQYHHIIDVAPTILEACGVEAPKVLDGIKQMPFDGVPMNYAFETPDAKDKRTVQYYKMFGNRPGETKIEPLQVQWLPGLTTIGTVHRPYAGGEHAMFFSGGNRIAKIRITDDHFSMVDEVAIPGREDDSMSTTEIRRIVKSMEASTGDEEKYLEGFRKFLKETNQGSATVGNGTYTLMDKDGYYYAGWGTNVYKVGDVRPGDVHSPIEIVKSYDVRDGVPADQRDKLSRIFGFALTYDGHLAIAMPGIIAVMDRDFGGMQYILLGDEAVDNGISVDDKGGIYCVTSKYMRKVVWDGKNLSDKETDGAWKSEYDYVPNPKALSRGSGNTPTLMGFGPDDDKLVVVADAGSKISVIAFWRDEIPKDFKQKKGTKSRRIADQLPLKIKVPATIEWSPHVYGNGVMMMASAWPDPVKQADGKVSVFETVLTAGVTREAPVGAEKWSWNSRTKSFKSDWVANVPLQWALHPVSAASNTVSLTLVEDGLYSLVHVDWETGKRVGKVDLGTNPIFNTAGGFFIPLNEKDIYVTGVFGPVRISKKAK